METITHAVDTMSNLDIIENVRSGSSIEQAFCYITRRLVSNDA